MAAAERSRAGPAPAHLPLQHRIDHRHRARRGSERGRRRGRGGGGRRHARHLRLAGYREHEGSGAMNHLLRSYAPISDAGWSQLDREVEERLRPGLAARRLVDFSGPAGWEHSAGGLGRVADIPAPANGLRAGQRRVLALAELRADFTVARAELRDLDRGAVDLDFGNVDAAARKMAEAENVAVFHGWAGAGIVGIADT